MALSDSACLNFIEFMPGRFLAVLSETTKHSIQECEIHLETLSLFIVLLFEIMGLCRNGALPQVAMRKVG